MRLVDRLGDARSIAMLGFDRLREPDIGGAHLEFERLAATGEVGFDPLEFLFLLRGQVELAVEKRMKFGFAGFGRIGYQTADEHAGNRRGEGNEPQEKKTARRHRYCTSSKVEGTNALGGPNGVRGLAATAGWEIALPAKTPPPSETKAASAIRRRIATASRRRIANAPMMRSSSASSAAGRSILFKMRSSLSIDRLFKPFHHCTYAPKRLTPHTRILFRNI